MQNRTIRTTLPAVFALFILLLSLQYFYKDLFTTSLQAGARLLLTGLIMCLMAGLLYAFYQYTVRTDRLTNQVFEWQHKATRYLDALPEGVVIMNASQQISYLNQAGTVLLDLTSSSDARRLLSDWTTRFCEACLQETIPTVSATTLTIEHPISPQNTPARTLTVHTRPVYDAQGTLVETLSLLRDTTEENRKDEEVQRAHKMAEQAIAEREIFLANISHDIRTPLNAILGFSELLNQRKTEPDDHTYLEGIRTSGTNLLALINELLDLSRLESGQLTLEQQPVQLDAVLAAVAAEIVPKARHKNIQYRVEVDADVPTVFMADRLRLTQVLLTIATNAVNFTDEGGVSITVRQDTSDPLQRAQLSFTIDDTGKGIAADKLDHIFDRFGRVSDQAMYRSGGTGLGLNITHSLVALMGGTIHVQSRPGRGTTFFVRLPLDPVDASATLPVLPSSSAESQTGPVTAALNVLVVEDNILNQKVMAGYLNRYQLTPTIVNNGLEAVEILTTTSFDLIFMDIQMPVMDGYLATETIRQQLRLNTPIVAMTAYTMAGEQERCLAAGMNDYLSKPIRMHQLDNVLAQFMPAPASTPETTTPTNTVDMGTPIIDEAFLNELMDGDDELLAEMVSLFRQDLPTYQQTLFNAIEQQDHSAFKQTAHKFRSSLNSLAMLDTAKNLKILESDTTIDPLTKHRQLTSLFDEINHGLAFLSNRIA